LLFYGKVAARLRRVKCADWLCIAREIRHCAAAAPLQPQTRTEA